MNGLSADLRKSVSLASIVVCIIICIVSSIVIFAASFDVQIPKMIISVIVGTCVSILNFNLMALAGEKAIELSPGKARSKMTVNYLIRYAIYIVVLVIAIKVPFLQPVGVVLGFVTSIISLYLIHFFHKIGE